MNQGSYRLPPGYSPNLTNEDLAPTTREQRR